MPFGRSDFKVYKAAPAKVQFFVCNSDRKPINLVGKKARIVIVNQLNNETILHRNLTIQDEYKGLVQFELDSVDTVNWDLGFYHYSVQLINEDNSIDLLYVDQNQKAMGYFELLPPVFPQPHPIVEINPEKFTPISYGYAPGLKIGDTRLVSSSYPGNKLVGYQNPDNPSHIVAFHTDRFSGKVWIQINNEDQVTSEDHENTIDWKYFALTDDWDYYRFQRTTGITEFTITEPFKWFRVMIEPDFSNDGEVQKVTYRII